MKKYFLAFFVSNLLVFNAYAHGSTWTLGGVIIILFIFYTPAILLSGYYVNQILKSTKKSLRKRIFTGGLISIAIFLLYSSILSSFGFFDL